MTVDVLNDPEVKAAAAHQEAGTRLASKFASHLISRKSWHEMDAIEQKICIRGIVAQVESEDDLQARLDEVGVESALINWHLSAPGDKTGDEARMLVTALGGLVSKNGALVQIMTHDGLF